MGWLFSDDTGKTITDLVAELSDPKRFSEGWTLLMSRRVGNHHWYLVHDGVHRYAER